MVRKYFSEGNESVRMDSGSRGGSEVARLRSHLRRVEHQLAEMREREANSKSCLVTLEYLEIYSYSEAAQIRQLEDVISTLRKEKNEMSRWFIFLVLIFLRFCIQYGIVFTCAVDSQRQKSSLSIM